MTATEDLFTPIHKALRSMIYQLSGRLQTHDFADLEATRALTVDLENDFAIARSAGCVLCVLGQHATDEETQIFPPVAALDANLVRSLAEEHHALTRREIAIAASAHAILELDRAEARIAAGIRLNQAANDLFGAYIVHMNREETDLVPRMREHFTDGQMAAMRGSIIAAMPPDRLLGVLGYLLPSLNVNELTDFLSGVRKGAPPALQKAVTDLGEARVDPTRWRAVKLRVGL